MGLSIKINSQIKYFFFLFLLSWSQYSFSYVSSQTKSGIQLNWSKSTTSVRVFINPENSQGLVESDVESIGNNSLSEWNNLSRINILPKQIANNNENNVNKLYFSSDPNIFNGTAVVGLTLVNFQEVTGEIYSANILLNDNFAFSTVVSDLNFLGNVITHESGHLLGLGHGQVAGSTMFFTLSRGQSDISNDDKAGIYSKYPNANSEKGMLTGKIVGGKKLALVFGAHVQAISVKTGKVMGAAITEIDGKFKIDGLQINDQYIIYTSPVRQMGLPLSFNNTRSDFCEGSTGYRGSFFQACGANSEGFPTAVNLSSAVVDVGNITIRCALDTPPEYFQNKNDVSTNFNINSFTDSGLGGTFVGFFSSAEVKLEPSPLPDYFKINFSDIQNWDSIYPTSLLYLELKIMNQPFYSSFKANVSVTRGALYNIAVSAPSAYMTDSDGWVSIDTVMRIPINRSLSSDNDFEVKITPKNIDPGTASETITSDIIDFSHLVTGIPLTKSDLFPSYSEFQENLYFYLMTATIVKENSDGTFTQVASKNNSVSDNSKCTDGVNTYALTKFSAKGPTNNSKRKQAVGCGIVVDTNSHGGGGSGPGGFMVGLLICFIMSYILTRYSKLA